MAKVTNTGGQPLYIGQTQIPAKSTVDVPDEELAQAKENKMVESWFANGSLKMGEADEQNKPATGVHHNVDPKAGHYEPRGEVEDKDKDKK